MIGAAPAMFDPSLYVREEHCRYLMLCRPEPERDLCQRCAGKCARVECRVMILCKDFVRKEEADG